MGVFIICVFDELRFDNPVVFVLFCFLFTRFLILRFFEYQKIYIFKNAFFNKNHYSPIGRRLHTGKHCVKLHKKKIRISNSPITLKTSHPRSIPTEHFKRSITKDTIQNSSRLSRDRKRPDIIRT